MNPQSEMLSLLAEIEKVLPSVTWRRSVNPSVLGADVQAHQPEVYEGTAGEWYLIVLSFDIQGQGFPAGSRGYDGAARKGSTIIRYTRPLAERVFKTAVSYAS